MKNPLFSAALFLFLGAVQSHATALPGERPVSVVVADNDKAAIEKVITTYRDALKEANAGKVVALYTKDAVLMPPGAPTAQGQGQVKATYEYVFKAIRADSGCVYL